MLLLSTAFLGAVSQAAPKWDPVKKEELADQKPKVEPNADAEILLREVEMDHSSLDESHDHYYFRIKIYTQRGVEDFAKIDLPYEPTTSIRNIIARTIKPNGATIELNPKDIYDREIIKSGDRPTNVRSFALPGLEPGVIVEYRYTEVKEGMGAYVPMVFQSDHPARRVVFKLLLPVLPEQEAGRPIAKLLSYNCPDQQFKTDSAGYYVFEMTDLPAAKKEPFQPPEINTVSCVLLYYAFEQTITPDDYWGKWSKSLQILLKGKTINWSTVGKTLATIVQPNDTANVKLQKIYDYCRTKIKNRNRASSGYTTKQLAKLSKNDTATETLKAGSGSGYDINLLFASLALAADMDVRFVACNDRTSVLFNTNLLERWFMFPHRAVAVREGDKWLYFDPGATYLPYATIAWKNTDTAILLSDKSGEAKPTQLRGPPAEATVTTRKANLQLDVNGTLEGDVTEVYTGYAEASLKYTLEGKTPLERETYVREEAQKYQKLAEVTAIVVENADSPTEPLKISYHLRIPEYADKTGTRIFFQPAVFQKGAPPLFEATTRRTALVFQYRYTVKDEVRILPPEGYILEEASAPGNVKMGSLGSYETVLGVNSKSHAITYRRTFKLTDVVFAKEFYGPIKLAFESVQKKDSHTLTLKRIEPARETAPPATESTEKTS